MNKLITILLFTLTLVPLAAQARAMIFIQGYNEDGSEWRTHGVTASLRAAGWSDGGHLVDNGYTNMFPKLSGVDQFYTIALPTEAPLMVQLQVLTRYIDSIRLGHPQEPLVLVGHSAGGVLGRLFMVLYPYNPVAALVTIASPHRGTGMSEVGLMVGQSPMSWGLPFIGADSINRSQGLFFDLEREAPGNFIFWLNREPHPASRYLSVIHEDLVVAPESQDMRFVAALVNTGMVESVYSVGDHDLNPTDGLILVDFLATLK